jgi:hypothetical protein
MEADSRVAAIYGASAVADWIQKSVLAELTVPDCLRGVVEPAIARGQLLPIADTCKAWHRGVEPQWVEALRAQMTEAERVSAGDGGPMSTVLVRLGVLQGHGNSRDLYDPRSALSVVEEVSALEEAVVRNEVESVPPHLQRTDIQALGILVLIPQMQEEVVRNSLILDGRSISDIPGFVGDMRNLAVSYREDSRYLLAPSQRETVIPYLLTAFLAVELARRGWEVGYTVEEGLSLNQGDLRVNPDSVVQKLAAGEMSREEFLAAIGEIS